VPFKHSDGVFGVGVLGRRVVDQTFGVWMFAVPTVFDARFMKTNVKRSIYEAAKTVYALFLVGEAGAFATLRAHFWHVRYPFKAGS